MEDDEGEANEEGQEEEESIEIFYPPGNVVESPQFNPPPNWVWWWSSDSSITDSGYGTAGIPPPSPSGSPEEPMSISSSSPTPSHGSDETYQPSSRPSSDSVSDDDDDHNINIDRTNQNRLTHDESYVDGNNANDEMSMKDGSEEESSSSSSSSSSSRVGKDNNNQNSNIGGTNKSRFPVTRGCSSDNDVDHEEVEENGNRSSTNNSKSSKSRTTSSDNSSNKSSSDNESNKSSSDNSNSKSSSDNSNSKSSSDNSNSKSSSDNSSNDTQASSQDSTGSGSSKDDDDGGDGNDDNDDDDDDDDDDSDMSGKKKSRKGERCPYCKKALPNADRLATHLLIYHVSKKRFHCEVCGKDFGRRDNLKRHQRNHQQELHVKCPLCEKTFARRDCLASHVANVHQKKRRASSPATRERRNKRMRSDEGSSSVNRESERDSSHNGSEETPNVGDDDSSHNDHEGTPNAGDDVNSHNDNEGTPNAGDDNRSHNDNEGTPNASSVVETDEHDEVTEGEASEENISGQNADDNNEDQDDILAEDPMEMPNEDHDNDSDDDDEQDSDDDEEEEDSVESVYRTNWASIRSHHRVGRRVQDVYNFRIGGGVQQQVGGGNGNAGSSVVERRLQAIFNRQRHAFKINMSYGYILRNTETGELRYFHSSVNNHRYFDRPFTIANQRDMDSFIEAVLEASVLDYGIRNRPNTKWTVAAVTNVTFYINKLAYQIGAGEVRLPEFIHNNKAIIKLTRNRNNGRPYKDKLCFFRCLALHNGASQINLERDTKYYYEKYLEAYPNGGNFAGIVLEELPNLERLFGLNIQVYSLVEQKDDSDNDDDDDDDHVEDDADGRPIGDAAVRAELVWRSRSKFKETMSLNLFGSHFSFITDLQLYSKFYRCSKCDTIFQKAYRLKRHEMTCDGNVKHIFPGGAYKSPPSVFEKLRKEDIEVEESMKYFPYRATYDFECYFEEVGQNSSQQTSKLRVEARHVPLSVSVASNVPGYDKPKHFVTNGNAQELLDGMVVYLEEISRASYETMQPDFQPIFEEIDTKMESLRAKNIDKRVKQKRLNQLERLRQELDAYLTVMPVLGFNSSRYDLNMTREYLYPAILRQGSIQILIKKGCAYQCIQTECLKFLDVTNYLAPGYSYRNFLLAYGAEVEKGFFPYEWLTSPEKLKETQLPPHEAFFSKLKNSNISAEDYQLCQRVWETMGMETMSDFLAWYNDLDVKPFLTALDNMFNFYKSLGIDMFKDAISVPGLTLKYLFSTLTHDDYFTLFKEQDKTLYYKMRQNIVGGPSVVFHRYHEKGSTFIRNGPKPCEEVVGYDANALYLWALMQPMPTGPYIVRSDKDNFKPSHAYSHGESAVEWLDWVAKTDNISIQHQFNHQEKRIGPRQIPVDGFCRESNTVYQFHGCYYHGHRCSNNQKEWNATRGCSMADLRQETAETSAYIKSEGFKLVEIYECQWGDIKHTNPAAASFVKSRELPLRRCRFMTMEKVIENIMGDRLFGAVECDIHVPEDLQEHFSEMPPIFKNCSITREDIGDHMQGFAEDNNMMRQPRRSLIGSMKGERILLITPLIKWYLQHGLKITAVYEVIEYRPSACFVDFGNKVVNARRAGDADPQQAVVAETMKLIGNSAYGKTLTNKEKFRDVVVCAEKETPAKINSPHFRQLNTVSDDLYEVEYSKKSIKLDLPIQIGFFVYGYAKLRMLSFYYDCVDHFLDREDFQYTAMDTDSAYLGLSGPFDSLIKPDLKEEFLNVKAEWFPRTDTEANAKFDKRKPGLFKEEWRGDGIVALCSKTYYCFGNKGDKYSCKGVNKKQKRPLTARRYLDVLKTKTTDGGINRGFRMFHGQMVTYIQEKEALPYLYVKRKVMEDGVSTMPLDL